MVGGGALVIQSITSSKLLFDSQGRLIFIYTGEIDKNDKITVIRTAYDIVSQDPWVLNRFATTRTFTGTSWVESDASAFVDPTKTPGVRLHLDPYGRRYAVYWNELSDYPYFQTKVAVYVDGSRRQLGRQFNQWPANYDGNNQGMNYNVIAFDGAVPYLFMSDDDNGQLNILTLR